MRLTSHQSGTRFLLPGAVSALVLSAAIAGFIVLAILTYHHSESIHTPSAENALLHLLYEGANFGVTLGYLAISVLIFRGLWRQGRAARSNYLGIAAGLIFATCSAGHLVHVGLAHLSNTALADGLLYAQVGADLAALLVAGAFLSLRERYSLLTGGEAAMVDMCDRLAERAEAETALRDGEERLRLALEAGGLGTWDWDITTGRVVWSEAVIRMLDVEGEPATMQTFVSRFHPEDAGGMEQAVRHAIRDRIEFHHEFRIVSRSGETRWVEGRGRVHYSADGRPVRMIGVSADITARKLAEEERERLQQQAAAAGSALEADRLKTQLLNTVSHELRTPLGVIKGFASTLLAFPDRLEAEEQRAFVEEIDGAADRLTDLVNDLLEVARLESGSMTMTCEPVRLGDVLERAASDVLRRYPDRRVALDAACNPAIDGDARRLTQVATNLIDNAVKFSPSGDEVAVLAGCGGGEASFSVSDRGIGIAPEHHGRIFERFYRVDTPSTRDIGGTGLGLAICREIVERHGGTIAVTSAEGAGTTVTVRLPFNESALSVDAAG
jgi:PAS domain S-box-containing protein